MSFHLSRVLTTAKRTLFRHVAGGMRLKSRILPALVSLIQWEQDPLVRRAAASLLLELYPAGAKDPSANDENERQQQPTGTVLDSVVASIEDMLQEDEEEQKVRATLAREEERRQNALPLGGKKWGSEVSQKESAKVKVKSQEQIARDRLSMETYVGLLGDLGALTECDLLDSALSKTSSGSSSLLMQALSGSERKREGGNADRHVLLRLLDVDFIAKSHYNFAPIRKLAIRALGIAMRGRPTANAASSVLQVFEEGADAECFVVALATLHRMERMHEFSLVIDWPGHLRRLTQLLGHAHMAVRAMAEQMLYNQMHLGDSREPVIQDALVTLLRHSSSLARTRALAILTSGHEANLIKPSAVMMEAITPCLYDQETIVRSQAHDLLKLLTAPTPHPVVAEREAEGEAEGEVDEKETAAPEAGRVGRAAPEAVVPEAPSQQMAHFNSTPGKDPAESAGLSNYGVGPGEDGLGMDGEIASTERGSGVAAAEAGATVEGSGPHQPPLDSMCVRIQGKETRWSELVKEPLGECATVGAKKHWIGSLLAMKIFDEASVTAVAEKLRASEHWSVRRSAVEYLLCALKSPPPPAAQPSEGAAEGNEEDNEEAARPVLVGWENEAETVRTGLAYLRSEDAGVRNSAAAMLKALIASGNGAREAVLEQKTLETLMADTRARQLCFRVFSSDRSLLEKCQKALEDQSVSVRRSATGGMCALDAHDPGSKALDMLLVCSRDPDPSVCASAMELWQKQVFAACDQAWRAAAVETLLRHARHEREVGPSRAIAVRAMLMLVHKGDARVAATMLDLLEDTAVQVREAAADALIQVADATSEVVGRLIDVVERHETDWNPPRRDGAQREIQAAAFWVLSKLEPQFSQIPDRIRLCGNRRIIQFLWGNADNERELIRQQELKVWVRETLAAGDSLLVKVHRAISEGRWEDARHDANQAMAEYLLARSKGSHPEIFERILMMDTIFSDIANFRGRTLQRAIDIEIQSLDRSWICPSGAIDREGWTRLHYLSRWEMPV